MISGRIEADESAADAVAKADLREAYERGRRDERSARKRHPLLLAVTSLLALAGAAFLLLAAISGSFSRAGGVVDRRLDIAADRAGPALNQAAGDAGRSLRDAGRSAKSRVDSAG